MTTTIFLYRLVFVLLALLVSVVKGQVTTYRATITEIEGTDSNVTGFVSIFTDSSVATIGYAGIVQGLQTNFYLPQRAMPPTGAVCTSIMVRIAPIPPLNVDTTTPKQRR
jgi:hypothetical protein